MSKFQAQILAKKAVDYLKYKADRFITGIINIMFPFLQHLIARKRLLYDIKWYINR